MSKALILLSFFACVAAAAAAAQAAQQDGPKPIGTFERWTAYSYAENGQPVCYVAAAPAKSDGKYTKRGDVFMLITHRPSQKSLDVVSFVAGYPFKPESQAELTVGKDKFMLFVKEERAWAPDDKADSTIVRGTSSRGTATVDHFSLKGFARAYDAINKACKVKR